MGVNFTTVYPGPYMVGGKAYDSEPWEAQCDECGERIDLDHYYDIVAHDDMHAEEHERERALAAKGGPRHRA